MKKLLVLMMAVMLPLTVMYGKKKEKSNIMVWGEVVTADDGQDYQKVSVPARGTLKTL